MAAHEQKTVRAWSTFEIKSVDEEQRIVTGIATTPATDRMGDIVESMGAEFKLPLPLLWQHDSDSPVGTVLAAKPSKSGIPVTVQIAKTDEPGALKDLLDKAWQNVKLKLVRGFSIGFKPLEMEPIDPKDPWGGQRFTSWMWLELSLVTIPANAEATIQTIKAMDVGRKDTAPHYCQMDGVCDPDCPICVDGCKCVTPTKAAPGRTTKTHAGAPAPVRVMRRQDKTMKKSYADQIAQWEATRAAKAAEQDGIQTKAADAGRAKDEAERETFETLTTEIAQIDKELADLRALEAREKAAAVAVAGATSREGLQARQGVTITVEQKLPKGIAFTRAAMCLGMSRGNAFEAREMAKQAYGDNAIPIMRTIEAMGRGIDAVGRGTRDMIERTAVAGGGSASSHYLDDMVPYNIMNDFIEFLRPGSIIGKFGGPNPGGGADYPALRRVGFNERVSGMSTGFVAGWKGEGLPALPTAAVTFNTSLLYNNMSALAVLTKEAIRFSNPSAEARVRDDLGRAVNTKLDVDFIDPAKAASGTTSPASITNGVIAVTPTGTTAAFLVSDMATLLKQFTANNLDASDVVLIMSASQALEISMMTTTLGMLYFPQISMKGGSFRGLPVIVSENLQGVGSPSTNSIVAVKASEVYLADDGVVTIDASDQASLEMVDSSSQSALTGTGASLVSLWQTGAVGLMATREITWKMRRSTAVGYISPAAYVA